MEYKLKEFRKNFTDFIALQSKDSGDRPFGGGGQIFNACS